MRTNVADNTECEALLDNQARIRKQGSLNSTPERTLSAVRDYHCNMKDDGTLVNATQADDIGMEEPV